MNEPKKNEPKPKDQNSAEMRGKRRGIGLAGFIKVGL